ncbi:MAG TPA: diaminopimelate epimerase [Nakamurella sp.]|jgi:diaminopimelate epimerase|nr:diaminopimelate epimerase [Nakamurella sp.]
MQQDLRFVKGHGTQNDFVLLPDPDGVLELTPALARAVCDRHAGLGADGVIRVARDESGRFLMDYRNADGSAAEMCGNGARLFARYLVDAGWAPPGRIDFVTRGGVRTAELGRSGDVLIHMGPVRLGPPSTAIVGGAELAGVAVDVGNPHLVCLIDSDPLELDLSAAPHVDPAAFPDGANLEVVQPIGEDAVRMRVHERGVGETRSCGTGTVAAAAAFLASRQRSTGTVQVQVLGGTVTVSIGDGSSTLTGPAVVVATGTLDPDGLPGLD